MVAKHISFAVKSDKSINNSINQKVKLSNFFKQLWSESFVDKVLRNNFEIEKRATLQNLSVTIEN